MQAREIELKFQVNDDAVGKIGEHAAFAAPAHMSRLRSVYFDTPDHELHNAGLGLRVRRDGDGLEQTLKAGGQFERQEWTSEVKAEHPDPNALADTPAAQILNGDGAALAPVFTTTVERRRWSWTQGEDVIEVSVDHGEITSGARSEPIHELELELKAGHPEALFELAAALSARTDLPLMFQSKAERGYRLADDPGWRPERAAPISLARDASAAAAFREVARNCLAQVATNADILRRYRSLEALHQMRVGLRRLRAALTAFRPMVEDAEFERIKTETKWLAGELDAARDIDVFIHESFRRLEPQASDREPLAKLGAHLLHAQSDAYERALAALTSSRFAELMLAATRWVEIGAWAQSDEPSLKRLREDRADTFAHDQLDSLRRKVCKRGRRLPRLDQQSRHRLRIKAKKLRYAAEFFAGSFGRAGRQQRFLEALEGLQDGLGRLHDVAVAPQLALDQVRGQSAQAGFAAGLIVAQRRADADDAEDTALKAFADFQAAKPFWR